MEETKLLRRVLAEDVGEGTQSPVGKSSIRQRDRLCPDPQIGSSANLSSDLKRLKKVVWSRIR